MFKRASRKASFARLVTPGVIVALVISIAGVAGAQQESSVDPAADGGELGVLLEAFRGSRTADDNMPGDYGRALEKLGDAQPGENPDAARRVVLPSGAVYLWPMKDGVCGSWGNCVPTESLLQSGVSLTFEFGQVPGEGLVRDVVASGIVRDGIDSVRLLFEDGSDVRVAVRENVFRQPLSTLPTRAEWVDESGQTHHQEIQVVDDENLP